MPQRGRPHPIRRFVSPPRSGHADNETIESCTILVIDANTLVQELHDQMPVVLAPEDYAAWLDPENKDAACLTIISMSADSAPDGPSRDSLSWPVRAGALTFPRRNRRPRGQDE
jgi:hypothetical protein